MFKNIDVKNGCCHGIDCNNSKDNMICRVDIFLRSKLSAEEIASMIGCGVFVKRLLSYGDCV